MKYLMVFVMRSGNRYDLGDDAPAPPKIVIYDLLASIATECRFYNQVRWSVLQHSFATGLAAERLYPDNRLLVQHAYCHDLHEAFVRDVPGPLKTEDMHVYEAIIQDKVRKGIGLPELGLDDEPILKDLDVHMALVESWRFFEGSGQYNEMIDNWALEDAPQAQLVIEATQAISDVLMTNNLTDEYGNISQFCLDFYRNLLNPN